MNTLPPVLDLCTQLDGLRLRKRVLETEIKAVQQAAIAELGQFEQETFTFGDYTFTVVRPKQLVIAPSLKEVVSWKLWAHLSVPSTEAVKEYRRALPKRAQECVLDGDGTPYVRITH